MTGLARACTRTEDGSAETAATSTMAATSQATLDTIQQIDCLEAWRRMSADARAKVGSLAIRRALLSLAGCTFEGNIVYLDAEHRDRADDLGMAVSDEQTGVLWDALPDLFGIFPCEEHPNGTDPFWATPMQRTDEVVIDILVEQDG